MMGPEKLSTIREELRKHFGKDGEDPIEWLNKHMAEVPEDTEVVESLKRFIEGVRKPRRKTSPKKSRSVKKR
jgi:hypothetical protein